MWRTAIEPQRSRSRELLAGPAAESNERRRGDGGHRLITLVLMDFVADRLKGGRGFRSLTVVDTYTGECLAIELEQRLKGQDAVLALN